MKIIIASDGSEFSRAAIAQCCRFISDPEKAAFLVVSAFEDAITTAIEPWATSAEIYQSVVDSLHKQAEVYARDATAELRRCLPGRDLDVTTKILRGAPERSIIEEAAAWGADLIVVGSHGRGFWGRLTLGSVSDAVVHHAPCSVLIVRKDEKGSPHNGDQ